MALHAWFQIMLCLCILIMLLVSSTLCFVALDSTQGGRNGGRTLTAACIRRKALKTLPFLKILQYKIHTRLQAQHAQCLAVILYQCCYSPADGLCVPMPSAPQGADALERATRVKIVIFDKTGTLTKGKPSVTNSHVFLKGKLLCTKTVELGLSNLTSDDASSMHTSANSLDGLHLGPCLPEIVALSLATWCVGGAVQCYCMQDFLRRSFFTWLLLQRRPASTRWARLSQHMPARGFSGALGKVTHSLSAYNPGYGA